ncbi:MAG: hypothetical protein KAW12_21785 [Candidatus Aminicenantes bacterium]|nr:hypothetical protein [Candidatus Aminicenantes bacterium]
MLNIIGDKVVWLAVVFFIILLINLGESIVPADSDKEDEKKIYVPLEPQAKKDAPPAVKIGAAVFDKKIKSSGKIPLKVEIPGVWRSKNKLNEILYDLFEIPGGFYTTEVGAPMVSTISLEIDIPPGAKFKGVKERVSLIKKFENVIPAPVQESLPVMAPITRDEGFIKEKKEFTIDSEIYKQTSPYPGRYSEVIADSFLGSRHIIILKLFPIQFLTAEKTVKIYSLEIDILFIIKK